MTQVGPPPASAVPRRRLPDAVWDALAIAVVLIAAIQVAPPWGFVPPSIQVVALLAAATCAVMLLLRRHAPVAVLVLCAAIFIVTVVVGLPSLSSGIAATIAAFTVGNRTTARTSLIGVGSAAGAVAVLSVLIERTGALDLYVFQFATAWAIAALLGDGSRARREYVQAVTERAERAEQTREAEARRRVAEERLRIAQDLHDTVAHHISVISLNAGVAAGALEQRPDKAQEALATIRSASRGVLTEIGELLRYLRADDDRPEPTRPQPTLANLEELIDHMTQGGLQVHRRIEGDLRRVTGTAGLVGYRLVQEGLTNARKHAGRPEALLEISVLSEQVRILITNPVSDRRAEPAPGGGLGLTGIRERVASAHGVVSAGRSGNEFRLEAQLPLTGAAA